MVCLGIDAEEFNNIHADALIELNRAAFWAKNRKNQDAYLATQSAMLQIRSIQRRVNEEWQMAMREEVDRSEADLRNEWKRRRRRGPTPMPTVRSRAPSRVSSCTEDTTTSFKDTKDDVTSKEIKDGEGVKTGSTRRWLCF